MANLLEKPSFFDIREIGDYCPWFFVRFCVKDRAAFAGEVV